MDDINHRAIIEALGLDQTSTGRIQISAQIPIILDFGSKGAERTTKPFHVVSSESDSSYGAISGLETKTGKNLFLGQLKAVVISTDLARNGLRPAIDFLEREPVIPIQTVVLLTKGSALEILNEPVISKEIPAHSFRNFLRSAAKADLAYLMAEWELLRDITSGPEDAYLPLVAIDKPEHFSIRGIGVFHRDRLVGELSDTETRMFGFLANKAKNAYLSLPVGTMGQATFRQVTVKTKIKTVITGNRIEFFIKTRAKGLLVELTGGKLNFKLNELKLLEKAVEHTVTEEMQKTALHLQAMNSDIFGWGELLRATRPAVWRRIKWEDEFPRAMAQINFRFNVERTGTYR